MIHKYKQMKKIILGLSILAFMSCEQDKIGFVDNVRLMNEYQQKIDIESKFKIQADALKKKRDSISLAFQTEAQVFQAKADKMSKTKAQQEYAALQQRGQFIGQQLQQEDQKLQNTGQVEMDSIISKVKKEIKTFGKSNNYTYILGGGDGGSVLYGKEARDLTDEVITLLNKNYSK